METVEVEVTKTPPFTSYFNKDGSKTPGYTALRYRNDHTSWWSRGNRSARDRRKGTEAKYRQPRKRAEKQIEQQLTGNKIPRLVDSLDDAKQFRKKDGALKACERLKGVYGTLDIAVDVRYQGDTR